MASDLAVGGWIRICFCAYIVVCVIVLVVKAKR
jgi:hypothetical protein